MKLNFAIAIAFCFYSCKPLHEMDTNKIGYIIQLQDINRKSIDVENDFWYAENLLQSKEAVKISYLLFKDLYDVKLCSEDPIYAKHNETFKESINTLINDKQLIFQDKIEKNRHISIIKNDKQLNVYKVRMKYSICSKNFSLFGNLTKLNEFVYPFEISFQKFSTQEKKNLKLNQNNILPLLK